MEICSVVVYNYKEKRNLIQKQPSCKKSVAPKKAIVKEDVKSKVTAKNGCDGRLIAKILITTI